MPEDDSRDQTDGDPRTKYEDTSDYERYGIRVGDNPDISNEKKNKPADLLPDGEY